MSITNRAGLAQRLTWSGSPVPSPICETPAGSSVPVAGQLWCVTDAVGRQLVFSYDQSGRLSKVFDPAGNKFVYGYDLFAGSHLISVTYPDTKLRGYLYNESTNTSGANLPYALTGVTDKNGSRYATYKYDGAGRAISSEHAGGADRVALSYASGSTTVTDARNTARTYTFQTTLGVARPSALDQPCGSGCGPSDAASITYDANGNVASRADFDGNQTVYAYDLTRNLETMRAEGLTAEEPQRRLRIPSALNGIQRSGCPCKSPSPSASRPTSTTVRAISPSEAFRPLLTLTARSDSGGANRQPAHLDLHEHYSSTIPDC